MFGALLPYPQLMVSAIMWFLFTTLPNTCGFRYSAINQISPYFFQISKHWWKIIRYFNCHHTLKWQREIYNPSIPTWFPQHSTSQNPPYTPQYNGSTKRWHRHIIETELTLLYQASIPLSYWSYAFLIATCLINKLPTPILSLVSPLEKLFSKQPNYHKQKKKLLSLLSLIASLYSSQTWSKSHPMYFSCPFISSKTLSLPRPLHEQVVTS